MVVAMYLPRLVFIVNIVDAGYIYFGIMYLNLKMFFSKKIKFSTEFLTDSDEF